MSSPSKDFNANLIEEFRANGGKVTGPFENRPLLLLTTVGAKSGKARTSPLVYTTDGDRMVIIASKGGAPTHPDWYYNLIATPEARVELGPDSFAVIANEETGDERQRLYDQMASQMPFFADYQKNTERQIPLFTLTRETS